MTRRYLKRGNIKQPELSVLQIYFEDNLREVEKKTLQQPPSLLELIEQDRNLDGSFTPKAIPCRVFGSERRCER